MCNCVSPRTQSTTRALIAGASKPRIACPAHGIRGRRALLLLMLTSATKRHIRLVYMLTISPILETSKTLLSKTRTAAKSSHRKNCPAFLMESTKYGRSAATSLLSSEVPHPRYRQSSTALFRSAVTGDCTGAFDRAGERRGDANPNLCPERSQLLRVA